MQIQNSGKLVIAIAREPNKMYRRSCRAKHKGNTPRKHIFAHSSFSYTIT